MRLEIVSDPIPELDRDLVAIGLVDGQELPPELSARRGVEDLRTGFKKLTLLRPERPPRLLVVGLGKDEDVDAERLRVAAALATKRAAQHEARSIAWVLPRAGPDAAAGAAALVEGTILAAYRFDRYRSRDPEDPPPPELDRLTHLGRRGRPGRDRA